MSDLNTLYELSQLYADYAASANLSGTVNRASAEDQP